LFYFIFSNEFYNPTINGKVGWQVPLDGPEPVDIFSILGSGRFLPKPTLKQNDLVDRDLADKQVKKLLPS
jgi:hypothetical protein